MHRYSIGLKAGQVLEVEVDQQGIDAASTLLGPQREVLLEVDSPSGTRGRETVFAVAGETGTYRLDVRGEWLPSGSHGAYQLRAAPVRVASARDRLRASAAREHAAGYRLQGQRNGPERLKAIAPYKRSLRAWERLGDVDQQAVVLYQLGRVYKDLGDLSAALSHFRRALELSREPRMRTVLLTHLGWIYSSRGESQKAHEALAQALGLARQTGDLAVEAGALNNLGVLYLDWGALDEAAAHFEQALDRWRRFGRHPDRALALSNLGRAYVQLGKPRRALDVCLEALEQQQAAGDLSRESQTLRFIGIALSNAGRPGIARRYLERALEQARKAGDLVTQITALNDLGSMALDSGDLTWAQAAFLEALRFSRAIRLVQGETYALQGLGRVQHLRGDLAGALAKYREAEEVNRRVGDRHGLAASLYLEALAERDQGRSSQALARARELLALVATMRSEAGSRDLRSSFTGIRSGYEELYIDLLMQRHAREPGGGYDVQAFEASERFRARALLEGWSEARAAVRASVSPVLLARQAVLEHQLQEREDDRLGTQGVAASRLDEQIRGILERLSKLQDEIARSSPRYAALSQVHPSTLREIQQLLDGDTGLVAYRLGQDRSFVWWIERDSLVVRELAGRTEIEETVHRAYELLARRPRRASRHGEVSRALEHLSQLLLAPLAGLPDKTQLLIVPDGALPSIPFGALPDPRSSQPLAAHHVLTYLPSASLAVLLRAQRAVRVPPPRLLAVLGDPVFGRDDSRLGEEARSAAPDLPRADGLRRLPESRREAEAILGLVPEGMKLALLGFDANRQKALSSLLHQYRYLHFGTHGIVDPRQPELSGLLLSRLDSQGRSQEGLLRFYEIYKMDLPVELVTLGSCRSAVGPRVRGEGLIGVTRSFLYAGASRVVGSLWDVDDKATAELTIRLYRGILREGKPPAVALQDAQVSMMQEEAWSSPYYWAGFVLQGEWR